MDEDLNHETEYYLLTNEDAIQVEDYKSLGYTPEGLKMLLEHGKEIAEELQKYKQAEAENRLIILPVASNMYGSSQRYHIFCDGAVFVPHCAGEIKELDHWYYDYPMIYQDFRGEHDFVLDPDEYNKTWFTDKDACKKYLDEKYGHLNE